MTGPVTTEALVDRKALRKAILAAIPENVPLRGRYASAITEQAVAPLLAVLQQVTAERDEYAEALMTVAEVGGWQASVGLAAEVQSALARLRAEGEAKDRALKDLRADANALGARLGNTSQYDDPKVLRDLCWEAGNFLARRIVQPALARAATAREG